MISRCRSCQNLHGREAIRGNVAFMHQIIPQIARPGFGGVCYCPLGQRSMPCAEADQSDDKSAAALHRHHSRYSCVSRINPIEQVLQISHGRACDTASGYVRKALVKVGLMAVD